MPTVSLALTALMDLASVVPSKLADPGNAEDFLALFNSSGPASGGDSGQPDAPRNNSKDQNTPTPPAASLDIPTPVIHQATPQLHAGTAPKPSQPAVPTHPAASDTNPPAGNPKIPGPQTADKNSPAPRDSSASDNSNNQENAGNISQDEQKLRSQLRGQLAAIDQILLSIIQSLSGAAVPAAPAQPALTDNSATPAVDGMPASPAGLLLSWQAQLSQSDDAPATTSTDTANAPASPELALLTDIQSLLQQLQQALQAPGDQGQPSQDPLQSLAQLLTQPQSGGQDSLQALTGLLQTDVSKLSQLLQPATAAPSDTSAPAAVTPPPLSDLGTLLKDSIAQARDQLKQLQDYNQKIFERAQSNLQAQLPQNTPALTNLLAGSLGLTPKDPLPAAPAPAINSGTDGTAQTPAAQNVPVLPAVTSPQFTVQPAVLLDVTQNGTGNPGGNNSGGNQDQGMPQIVLPTTPGTTQAAGASGGASFSSLLEQAAPRALLDQVSFNVKTALADGSSKIHIQLDPAELGKLDIRLDVGADGKTGVVITADNKNTLSLLQQDAQGLARALADAGLTTDGGSLSFNLGGQNPGQGQPATTQAAFTYQKSQPDDQPDPAIGAIISRSYVVNLTDGLDITI